MGLKGLRQRFDLYTGLSSHSPLSTTPPLHTILLFKYIFILRWGEDLRLVASQDCRQRTLFGTNYPPVIEEVTAPRFIVLEIIGRARWEGFMQADFQRLFSMDSRTSFHHVKVLIQLHLITKQVCF